MISLSFRRVAAALLVALLAGCASTGGVRPAARGTDPNTLSASRSLDGAALSEAAWPTSDWWKRYNDPQLDALVTEALAGSPTLRAADARVRKALAAAGVANAARYPQVNGSADVLRLRLPEGGTSSDLGGKWNTIGALSASLTFDLDLWGRNRSNAASALDAAHAAQVDAAAARIVLAAAVVHAYVQLQHVYDQLDVQQDTLTERTRIRDLIAQRAREGLDSQIELKQSETSLPETRERIAALEETVAVTRNQLAALLGEGPDRGLSIARPHMSATGAVALPTRIPADLIGRRPDIVAARWSVEAARKQIDVAKAEFYPNVNLIGLVGLQSIGLSHLFNSGSVLSAYGPAVSLPIFEGGRLRSQLAGHNADYDIAVEQYNQALADALREVVDQLAAFRSIDAQKNELELGLRTAQQAYDLATLRYREGLGNYLQVLSAEAQVLTQKSLRADLAAREIDVSVNLTRALGGGFNDTQGAPIVGAAR
jgi:NodT family efflux transporter outer membrane factor (OMF) lipoprotein